MTATTPTFSITSRAEIPFSSTFATVTSMLAAGAMALLGVVAVSLGVTFPLVVSLAEAGRITISPADLAASQAMAGAAWLYGLVALAHIAGAFGALTDVTLIRRGGFVLAGTGAALAMSAAVIVLRDGGTGAADGAAMLAMLAAVYLYVVAVIAIPRRTA